MRLLVLMILGMVFLSSCNSSNTQSETAETSSSSHHIEILEVLQPGGYTYLFVEEGGNEYWIATDRMDAKVGEDYYYKEGMEMNDFKSKELDRTFETIYFVDKLSTVPILDNVPAHGAQPMTTGKREAQQVEEINVDPAEGGITIAELYKNSAKYEGKRVVVRGQIVKVNNSIMNRNWVHLQDGTNNDGNFDLTVTTDQMVNLNDVVTFEGLVSLNKDFGAGYTYELLVEEAVIK